MKRSTTDLPYTTTTIMTTATTNSINNNDNHHHHHHHDDDATPITLCIWHKIKKLLHLGS